MEKFSEIEYKRPDVAKCKKELKGFIKAFKSAKSYDEMRSVYLEIDKELGDLYTTAVVANVRSDMDKSDKFYEGEIEYLSKAEAGLALLGKKLNKALVDSPFRSDFVNEFGDLVIKQTEASLKLMNIWIIPDMIKEDALSRKYSKDAAMCSTDFRGEKCNFYGLLKHMQSTDRNERKESFEAWAKLYEGISAELDATYDKLVALRVKMAKKLGFSNYIDYIYLARGRYDYTASDVEKFRRQVREVVVPACAKLMEAQRARLGVEKLEYYDEQLVFPEGNALPIGDKDYLVGAAKEMYRELSPESGEFFDFMTENELFDLETRSNKHMGGYCTFLPKYKAPFIFSNFNGTSADVDVLTHEAGHAFEAYVASRCQKISDYYSSTSEINEIHSMTMEHFTYPWMDKFFGENTDKYKYAHLCTALTTIPYLVAVDEFQHRVFEHPAMTALERRQVWSDIEKAYMPWRSYDGNKFLEGGGFWMQKQHIFLYPFYYVDYALAQMGAFTLYLRMLKDKDAAWNDYMRLLRAGGSKGYFELLDLANIKNPFSEGTIQEIVDGVMAEIDKAKI